MLLTITSKNRPATDIGYLLHKNPERCQEFELNFGKAYVFYPEATENQCTAALLLDIDPVSIVRGKSGAIGSGPLSQYVNDRPYVGSSFLSVAISKVYGSALNGKCKTHPELINMEMPLTAKISVLPCRGGEAFLHDLFEPLGYSIKTKGHSLNSKFKEWGDSVYFTVELAKVTTVQELLNHLYVLVPVLDNSKHYYIGESEVEKLLSKGEVWLAKHPQREIIAKRYLKYKISLAHQAIARLVDEEQSDSDKAETNGSNNEEILEEKISLNEQRIGTAMAIIKASGAERVLDVGCGEGKLIKELLKEKTILEIVGMDVSVRSLEIANRKLGMDRMPERMKNRVKLIHGSLMYRDKRFYGFDTVSVIEVIEHLDQPRLAAFEKVLFQYARPGTIVLTTPNREYNITWENMSDKEFRHRDHRFEWTRDEFRSWAIEIADKYNYEVNFLPVGPEDKKMGAPTQMGVFKRGN